ncbi:MAG: hypothetical protein ABSG03_13715, partial [Bryobacteraceae bacterium]
SKGSARRAVRCYGTPKQGVAHGPRVIAFPGPHSDCGFHSMLSKHNSVIALARKRALCRIDLKISSKKEIKSLWD